MTLLTNPPTEVMTLLRACDRNAQFVETCGVAGWEIEARCDRAETAAWLVESVGVWSRPATGLAPFATVIQIGLPETLALCRDLVAGLRPKQAVMIDFYMQRRAWCWEFDGETRIIKPCPDEHSSPDRGVYPIHVLDPDECYLQAGDRIYVFSGAVRCVEYPRVVRDLLTKRAISSGWVLLRASAVGTSRGAVAFCGPKSVGKTTLLLAALEAHPLDYLGNGRLLVRAGEAGVEAIGIPIVAGLRGPTVRAHRGIAEWLLEHGRPVGYPQEAWWRDNFAEGERQGHKVGLLPQELAGLFGRQVLPSAVVTQIVLLERASGAAVAEPMSPEASADALLDELLDVEGPYFPDVFRLGVPATADYDAAARAAFTHIGHTIGMVRVRGDQTTAYVLDRFRIPPDAPPSVSVSSYDQMEVALHD